MPDLADRFSDCSQARTQLESHDQRLDVAAPWAGDLRTLPVRADNAETAGHLADRIANQLRAPNEFDSITLLSNTGVGPALQEILQGQGLHVRVYEPTAPLKTDPQFTITDGGHWEVYGRPTVTHNFTLTRELSEALQKNFPYAAAGSPAPGGLTPLSDRVGTLRSLETALAAVRASRNAHGGVLDLAAAAHVFGSHQTPAALWPVLLDQLSGELGGVREIADMYEMREKNWRMVDLPIAVRRMFTATGPHRLAEGLGVRTVTFNRPHRLLGGEEAATRPEAPEALAVWLAESTVDRKAQGLPATPAGAEGDTQQLHRDLIARLDALNVSPEDARLWAAESIGAMPAQEGTSTSPQITIPESPGTGEPGGQPVTGATAVDFGVPLGGGILEVLRHVTAAKNALAAGYEMAAHFLHDRFGMDVAADDVADLAPRIWLADVVAEVVALLHLRLHAILDPRTVPVLVQQPMPVILSAVSPVLRAFLSAHERDIRQVMERTFSGLGDSLSGLFEPEQPGRLAGPVGPIATTADDSTVPWRMPEIRLRITADVPADVDELLGTARAAASLNTGVGLDPEVTEALTTSTRSVALGRLHDAIDRIRSLHPELAAPAQTATANLYRRAVAPWLATALADLPVWTGGVDDSVRRAGQVLLTAGAVRAVADMTAAPALAWALDGEWRDITAGGLWQLPVGAVTVVWVQREHAPERVVFVQRTTSGVVVVETQTRARVEITLAAGPSDTAVLGTMARVVVDADRRIVILGPDSQRPAYDPLRNADWNGNLAAPRFDGPTTGSSLPGAGSGVAGVRRLGRSPNNAIVVDVRTATFAEVAAHVDGLPPGGGVLVVHGTSANSPLDGFAGLARRNRLHFLEPARSIFPEPLIVSQAADDFLISPTGWWVVAPDGTERLDLRGALSVTGLVTSPDQPIEPIRRSVAAASAPILPEPGPLPGEPLTVEASPVVLPSSADTTLVRIALVNLHLILDERPSWVPEWSSLDDDGAALRQAARRFGDEIAAVLARQLSGAPVAPPNVVDFLHIESVAVVRSLAMLAYMQAHAAAYGLAELPLRSRLPFDEVIGRLAGTTKADPYTARGGAAFLRDNRYRFHEQLVGRLGGSVTVDTLRLDPSPVATAARPSREPSGPAAIELELLRPGPHLTPLPSADLSRLARFGPASDSALDIYSRARSEDGRRAIADTLSILARHRTKNSAAAESAPPRTRQRPAGALRQVAERIWAYLPTGASSSVARDIEEHARAMRPAPDTVTIAGAVASYREALGISLGEDGYVTPRQVVTAFFELARSSPISEPTLALRLYGEERSLMRFAQLVQTELDNDALLGVPGARTDLLVGSFETDSGDFVWHEVQPGTRLVQRTAYNAPLPSVRGRGLRPLDFLRELRDRLDGHSDHPEIASDAVTELAAARVDEVPTYSERGGGSEVEMFREAVMVVPVRPNASTAELMESARTWMHPGAVRELLTPRMNRNTAAVRLGIGLRGYVHRLPQTGSARATSVTTMRSDGAPVWVNRHRPVPLRRLQVTMTAVALPPHLSWSFLDSLPTDVLRRLTIEPAELRDGLIQDGEELLDARAYAGRLALGERDKPIVVLPHAQDSADTRARAFTTELSKVADVIRLEVSRQDGRGPRYRWQGFDGGRRRQNFTGDLDTVFQQWTRTDDGIENLIISPRYALSRLLNNTLGGPDSEAAIVIRRELARAPLYRQEVISGWLSLPPFTRRHGLVGNLLQIRDFRAGLIPLRDRQFPFRRNIEIHVPARYVRQINDGVRVVDVVDVAELAADGAYLRPDGSVAVPPRPSVQSGARRFVDLIRAQSRSSAAVGPSEQRIGKLFVALTGIAPADGGSALTAWADDVFARFRPADRTGLEGLGLGAGTPVRLSNGEVILAVGTEQIQRPMLLGPDGESLDAEALTGEIELLFDNESRLAQVDASVPEFVLVDARPRTTPLVPNVDLAQAERRVSEAIRAGGGTVPDDLRQRLSERLSVRVSHRASVVTRSMARDLARDDIQGGNDEPADQSAVRRATSSMKRVSQFLQDNGSGIPPEEVDHLLFGAVASMMPGFADSDMPAEMVRSVGLEVQQRHAVAMQQALRTGQSARDRRRTAPMRDVDIVEEASSRAPYGYRPEPPPVPYPPVVIFSAPTNGNWLDVVIVDTQRARPAEVERMLDNLLTTRGRIRGFLVLREVNYDRPEERIYPELAWDRGLRVIRPAATSGGRVTADRTAPHGLFSRTGWMIGDAGDQWRPAEIQALEASDYAALYESPQVVRASEVAGRVAAPPARRPLPPRPLPQPPGFPAPSRMPAANKAAAPPVIRTMMNLLDEVSAGATEMDLPGRLAERLFPAGLRTIPASGADTMPTRAWVTARVHGEVTDDVHQPPSWGRLKVLVVRAGPNGTVLTSDGRGRNLAIYMSAGDEIWRIVRGENGAEATVWNEPSALSTTLPEPPRMVLAFTHCADPVPVS